MSARDEFEQAIQDAEHDQTAAWLNAVTAAELSDRDSFEQALDDLMAARAAVVKTSSAYRRWAAG